MGRCWLGGKTDAVLERALDHAARFVARKWTLSKRDFVRSAPPWAIYTYHSTDLLRVRRGSCESVGCDKGCAKPHEVRQVFFPKNWPTVTTYARLRSLCVCTRAPGGNGWRYPDPEEHAKRKDLGWWEGLAWDVDDVTLQFVDGKLQGSADEDGKVRSFPEGLGTLARTPRWVKRPGPAQTVKVEMPGAKIEVLGGEVSIEGRRAREIYHAMENEEQFVKLRPLMAALATADLLRPAFIQRHKGRVFAARMSVGAAEVAAA